MAQNPFGPQSNMSFFGGVNDMSTTLPGGRSTFNSAGPNIAAAPATTAAATDPNATAISNAASSLGTTATSPFSTASNLNFSGAASTPDAGTVVGGGTPNPNAVQGPQYAAAGSGLIGAPTAAGRPYEGSQDWIDLTNRARDAFAVEAGITSGAIQSSLTAGDVKNQFGAGDYSWQSLLDPTQRSSLNSSNWMSIIPYPELVPATTLWSRHK